MKLLPKNIIFGYFLERILCAFFIFLTLSVIIIAIFDILISSIIISNWQAIYLPVITRWGSHHTCLQSFFASKKALQVKLIYYFIKIKNYYLLIFIL